MKWYPELYVGKTIAGKEDKIKKRISKGHVIPYIYLLCIPAYGTNQLEFFKCEQLMQKLYPKDGLTVVGITGERSEAIDLILQLTQESLDTIGRADIPSYLMSKWKEGNE